MSVGSRTLRGHVAGPAGPPPGAATGSPALELAVLEVPPGTTSETGAGDRETVLFVVGGEGTLVAGGGEHPLEPETGAVVPAGTPWTLRARGTRPLAAVAVAVAAADGERAPAVATVRAADQEARAATSDRQFRLVVDPEAGCRSVTQFVGLIPPGRAPDHFHHYDEVIYVLDGRGVLHMEETSTPVGAGSTIHLPPRLVHSLENAGDGTLRVLGVFRPAGSPSEAYYPDGTPAVVGPQDP
jgi:mannose-6-phosphate isomerase-like protein (cupin superfamily)